MRKELVDTIRRVHAGQRRIPYDIAAGIADHVTSDELTERELEVLRNVAADLPWGLVKKPLKVI
jgi:DNA-binding NarL/FixJ family response regulator